MAMNMNSLVSCFGASLRPFFDFCEKQNGVKADDLNDLFNQYFAVNTPVTKAKKTHEMSGSESESCDEDTSVSSKKVVKKKAAEPRKPAARKPSGKSAKPRGEQTPVADLNKKKLPELKDYARERGLPVSGTKAQLIENILSYEKEQEGSSDPASVEEEDLGIQIKKPKTKPRKMYEPADRPKYEVVEKHGVKMIYYSKLDGWFILNDKDVIVGWAHSDDEANADEDERIDIRALDKKTCKVARELGLEFEVPENLDA